MKRYHTPKLMYWIGGLLVLVLVAPNTLNFKERKAFSDEVRLEQAKELYMAGELGDSVTIVPAPFYDRSRFATLFLGKKNRNLWTTPVSVKVFNYDQEKGGMEPIDMGGGQQTISIKLIDTQERKWSLRSVNKDQKAALPKLLQFNPIRYLFRDQTASLNPYAALPIPVLAEAIKIHHNNPEMVFVPYNSKYGEYNERMAGRLAYLEENLNSSWKEKERYGEPEDIVNTEEMIEMQEEELIPFDTALYLKSRLFDMLISDWDRHPGNWEWALQEEDNQKLFEAIPKDRDNAFNAFDEGLFSHITLIINNKFQAYRKDFGKVPGLMEQSEELDQMILSGVPLTTFYRTVQEIQQDLTEEVIREAFRQYPPHIYKMTGPQHEEIMKERLKQLPEVSEEFYRKLKKNVSDESSLERLDKVKKRLN